MENKKITVGFELILIIMSLFAFPYIIRDTSEVFEKFDEEYTEALSGNSLVGEIQPKFDIGELAIIFLKELRKPIIPVVSASVDFSSMGCCEVSNEDVFCSLIIGDKCNLTKGLFNLGAICEESSFCEVGCCYDSTIGIYDDGILNRSCDENYKDYKWVSGSCSSIPGSTLGCCSLGTIFDYNTKRECDIESGFRGIEITNWDDGIGGLECKEKAITYEEGACVFSDGDCDFGTEESCTVGDFSEGVLCTNENLDTWCGMKNETACKPNRYEVYFKDTCGNFANVYNANKAGDQNYWNNVLAPSSVCNRGSGTIPTCGNCDFDDGFICAQVVNSSDEMIHGDYYCNDLSCDYISPNGTIIKYGNGESWCDFDSTIGKGKDPVGSKHWKYSCNQGVIEVGGCGDYRESVCVESSLGDFSHATCNVNNWKRCFFVNADEEEDAMGKCEDISGCYKETFGVGPTFNFTVCLPEYPDGNNIKMEVDAKSEELVTCEMGEVTCSVIREPKEWGGCNIVQNEECLTEDFAKEMNRFCTSLGDCGGAANFAGEYVKNFNVDTNVPKNDDGAWDGDDAAETFGTGEINRIIGLSKYPSTKPVIEMNYDDIAKAMGFSIDFIETEGEWNPEGIDLGGGLYFLSGIIGLVTGGHGLTAGLIATISGGILGAISGVFIGAMIGGLIADYFGLTKFQTVVLMLGTSLLLSAILYYSLANAWNLGGMILSLISLILIFLSWLSHDLESECDPINVTFDCQSWTPPTNDNNCDECNGNPLKPCSEYRCSSLGACELRDVVTGDGVEYGTCVGMDCDGIIPVLISPLLEGDELPSPTGMAYNENPNPLTGFNITYNGGCINTDYLSFGVNVSKMAKCKIGPVGTPFGEMTSFGIDAFSYKHVATIPIPKPTTDEHEEGAWTTDVSLEIKCQDPCGEYNPLKYTVKFCVDGKDSGMPPRIIDAQPSSGSFVGFNDVKKSVKIITNEPANCSWSTTEAVYESMTNKMSCSNNLIYSGLSMGYECEDEFDVSETEDENIYYIRCADQPWKSLADSNKMPNSYKYVLTKPDKKIVIDSIKPNEDMESGNRVFPIELEVKTSGGGDYHSCKYSLSGYETMIDFKRGAGSLVHTQSLDYMTSGDHKIRINCSDETGDTVSGETEFMITYDNKDPEISRVWQSGNSLYIVTNEDAECVYTDTSCAYNWDDEDVMSVTGSDKHTISVIAGRTYYIKCKDKYENMLSNGDCLVEVQAI